MVATTGYREPNVLTEAQLKDKASVWEYIAQRYPEFTQAMDPTENYHTVREIVLGGSSTWAEANKRFQPRPGTHVMDVGANVGIYTAFCAAYRADVTAYEPDPVTFGILNKMLRDTGLIAKAVLAAVHSFTGTAEFQGFTKCMAGCEWYNGGLFIPGVQRMPGDAAITVPCISFDEAIGGVTWDCVKMDIEGGEAETILSASDESLEHIKFMYMELHPWIPPELYEALIARTKQFYRFDGSWSGNLNRWEALYLEAK
jgi:FkbM family methyltransferase